jgi:hypothetical protein
MQRTGVLPHVIEKALNHVSGVFSGVAGVYQLDPHEPEVRAGLERWAEAVVTRIAQGKPLVEDKVVALPARQSA